MNTDLLSVKEWSPAHAAEVTYNTTGAKETPPTPPNDVNGQPLGYMAYRFARVEARSADLCVRKLRSADANPTMGSGDFRVYAGTAETFQLAYGESVWVAAVAGTANGAVIWGR